VRDGGFPGNGSLIRIDNPFLPNAIKQTMQANGITGLVIGKLGTDFGQMDSVSKRDTFRIVTGANGKLGGTWAWDGYVQYGVTDYAQSTVNDRITANYAKAIDAVADPVTGKPICRVALTDPNTACRPLDILGQGQFSPRPRPMPLARPISTRGSASGQRRKRAWHAVRRLGRADDARHRGGSAARSAVDHRRPDLGRQWLLRLQRHAHARPRQRDRGLCRSGPAAAQGQPAWPQP
jgi:hypothetical protein